MSRRILAVFSVTAAVIVALTVSCVTASATAPRFDNLGKHHRAITTGSEEVQVWFDQGFNLYFGFNHEEAIRSFEAAAAIEPDCAMAWWGIAMSYGPNINNPVMDADQSKLAWDALQKARRQHPPAAPRSFRP